MARSTITYTLTAQAPTAGHQHLPLKTVGNAPFWCGCSESQDAQEIQTNIVRVDGQPSVYLPILKQGGTPTRSLLSMESRPRCEYLMDSQTAHCSRRIRPVHFRENAIDNLFHEGAIGLVLTGLMILLFLGSMRATAAVFLSIPLSALAAFLAINASGGTVNTMVLGGLALAFSRLSTIQ